MQAEDSAVLFDEEAKLRAVQERRIESLAPNDEERIVSMVPNDKDMPNSTERRRGFFKRLWRTLKRWYRRYKASPWRVSIGRKSVGVRYHRKWR